jgi:hypothetical protein
MDSKTSEMMEVLFSVFFCPAVFTYFLFSLAFLSRFLCPHLVCDVFSDITILRKFQGETKSTHWNLLSAFRVWL